MSSYLQISSKYRRQHLLRSKFPRKRWVKIVWWFWCKKQKLGPIRGLVTFTKLSHPDTLNSGWPGSISTRKTSVRIKNFFEIFLKFFWNFLKFLFEFLKKIENFYDPNHVDISQEACLWEFCLPYFFPTIFRQWRKCDFYRKFFGANWQSLTVFERHSPSSCTNFWWFFRHRRLFHRFRQKSEMEKWNYKKWNKNEKWKKF